MNEPPLTSRHCPVTYEVRGDARARITPAASSAVPTRPRGVIILTCDGVVMRPDVCTMCDALQYHKRRECWRKRHMQSVAGVENQHMTGACRQPYHSMVCRTDAGWRTALLAQRSSLRNEPCLSAEYIAKAMSAGHAYSMCAPCS